MDDSMEDFYAGRARRPQQSSSSRPPIGLGIDPAPPSSALPDPAHAYHTHSHSPYAQPRQEDRNPSRGQDASFASVPEDHTMGSAEDDDEDGEDDDDEDDEEEEGEDGEGDGMSETSSAMYDPATDPEGFAKRLDELAGTLEISEEEARALRQGPAIGKGKKTPILPLSDFKNYINHYLTTTEWKYAPPPHAESLLRRQGAPEVYQPGEDIGQLHPIRALGRSWVGRDVNADGMELMEGLGITEGLPRLAEEGRAMEGLMR